MKRLAVLVLNWNGIADTVALLQSLQRVRVPAGWEARVTVVDNGSSDGSVGRIRAEFPSIEVLALPENRRFAGGNNAGLAAAMAEGADAVMLLNNDTEADPGLFEALIRALEGDPSAGAASPLIDFADPRDRIWYAGGRLSPGLAHSSHRGIREPDRGQYHAVEPTGYLTGCCLLATRAAWEKVGPLDERYFIYAEDADWSLRAREAGFRLLFVPTAKLWHKVSASSGAQSPWKIYQRLRANLTMFARHARGFARITWLPSFLAQQAALMGWLILRGQIAAALAVPRALADAATGKDPAEVRA